MRYIIIKILNILSKKILAKYEPVVIGVAGSAGKSSVKKTICELLKDRYKIAFNKNHYKTDIGIPLAIIGAESGGRSIVKWLEVIFLAVKMIIKKTEYPEILILEMGVDSPGDMKKMLEVVKPNIGILTNIGKFPSRLKYFKNAKHSTREKSLFLKSLKKKDLAILNCDDECIRDLLKNTRSKIITYGFNNNSIVKAGEIFSGDKKMSFKISYQGTFVPFRLPRASDKNQVYAVLAASAIGIHFGYNLVEISEKLSSHRP
ncbi:MAG: hypothetical protein KAQ87_01215 [Candidatus Pacebacteria bacterium]|nr:hypothetical protein [Candidatus Paceibacterota bacterium]